MCVMLWALRCLCFFLMLAVLAITARRFTRNDTVATITMNPVVFKLPIYATDLVELFSRVVRVCML